jgi:hypothetical protein
VLIDFDNSTASRLFGNSSVKASGGCQCGVNEDLGPDGSPIVMQLEMEKEVQGGGGGGEKKEGKSIAKIVEGFTVPRANGQQENPKYQQMHVPFRNWRKEVIVRINGDKTGRNPGAAIPQYIPPGPSAPILRGRGYVQEYLEQNDLPASMIDAFDFPELFCVCHRQQSSDLYIKCSANIAGCGGWIHPHCVGWTNAELSSRAERKYECICPLCTAYIYATESVVDRLIIK